MKKAKEKHESSEKIAPGAEKFWSALVKVYFRFYASHFRDQDGHSLSPSWNEKTRGMESKGLKQIITRLRTISEEKKIEWTEEVATRELNNFLQKAYASPFYRRNFLCCMLNKYIDMIIVSDHLNPLVKKIIDAWYRFFPDKKDFDRDVKGAQIIIGYLKQQYLQKNILFTDDSVMSSVMIIFSHIKQDDFWCKKSLVSVGYNLSEFILRIKNSNNGNTSHQRITSDSNRKQGTSEARINKAKNW